jgi:hypothetical protein
VIIVCDPDSKEFVHAETNAALIHALLAGFPEEQIVFHADKGHAQLVREEIQKSCPQSMTTRLDSRYERIPARTSETLFRFPHELALIWKLLRFASAQGTSTVVFCAINSPALIALKLLMRMFPRIRCYVVLHMILETIRLRPSVRPWRFPFWFGFAFRIGNSVRLKYLLLAEPIETELSRTASNVLRYCRVIEHPAYFRVTERNYLRPNFPLTFGYFGVASRGKGADHFFSIAATMQTRQLSGKSRFIVVGKVIDPEFSKNSLENVYMHSVGAHLSRGEMDALAKDVDYAVFCHPKQWYRLTASGAFFDALAYTKPIVALRIPLFEHYFQRMGDIGYLCEDFEQMQEIIAKLILTPDLNRYAVQCRNIASGREEFSTGRLAGRLRTIILETP